MRKILLGAAGGAVALFNVLALSAPVHAQSFSHGQALAYAQRRDWSSLARYASAWSAAEPTNAEAWGALGVALGTTGLNQPERAVAALKRSVALDPSESGAWAGLGVNELAIGQSSAAVDAFLHARRLAPNYPNYYNNLAVAYREAGDITSAVKTLDSEVPLAERLHDAATWYVLGNAYSRLHDGAAALRAYKETLALQPDFAPARKNVAALEEYLRPPEATQGGYRPGVIYPGHQYNLNRAGAPGNTCSASAASGCN